MVHSLHFMWRIILETLAKLKKKIWPAFSSIPCRYIRVVDLLLRFQACDFFGVISTPVF